MQKSDSYELDPNFAVVCSFLERFGHHFGEEHRNVATDDLKAFLEDENVGQENVFIKLHRRLLRGIGNTVKAERFAKDLMKFAEDFPERDDMLIQSAGYNYGKIPVAAKLRIFKNLLEDQFEFNDRFNQRVNEDLESSGDIRHTPLGHDKLGRAYWCLLDKTGRLLLYRSLRNEITQEETWALVCSDVSEFGGFIDLLEDGSTLEKNDDPSIDGSTSIPLHTPIKVSASDLTAANSADCAQALFFNSPRFFKPPKLRSKQHIHQEEKKYDMPHCSVKLERLDKKTLRKYCRKSKGAWKQSGKEQEQDKLVESEGVKTNAAGDASDGMVNNGGVKPLDEVICDMGGASNGIVKGGIDASGDVISDVVVKGGESASKETIAYESICARDHLKATDKVVGDDVEEIKDLTDNAEENNSATISDISTSKSVESKVVSNADDLKINCAGDASSLDVCSTKTAYISVIDKGDLCSVITVSNDNLTTNRTVSESGMEKSWAATNNAFTKNQGKEHSVNSSLKENVKSQDTDKEKKSESGSCEKAFIDVIQELQSLQGSVGISDDRNENVTSPKNNKCSSKAINQDIEKTKSKAEKDDIEAEGEEKVIDETLKELMELEEIISQSSPMSPMSDIRKGNMIAMSRPFDNTKDKPDNVVLANEVQNLLDTPEDASGKDTLKVDKDRDSHIFLTERETKNGALGPGEDKLEEERSENIQTQDNMKSYISKQGETCNQSIDGIEEPTENIEMEDIVNNQSNTCDNADRDCPGDESRSELEKGADLLKNSSGQKHTMEADKSESTVEADDKINAVADEKNNDLLKKVEEGSKLSKTAKKEEDDKVYNQKCCESITKDIKTKMEVAISPSQTIKTENVHCKLEKKPIIADLNIRNKQISDLKNMYLQKLEVINVKNIKENDVKCEKPTFANNGKVKPDDSKEKIGITSIYTKDEIGDEIMLDDGEIVKIERVSSDTESEEETKTVKHRDVTDMNEMKNLYMQSDNAETPVEVKGDNAENKNILELKNPYMEIVKSGELDTGIKKKTLSPLSKNLAKMALRTTSDKKALTSKQSWKCRTLGDLLREKQLNETVIPVKQLTKSKCSESKLNHSSLPVYSTAAPGCTTTSLLNNSKQMSPQTMKSGDSGTILLSPLHASSTLKILSSQCASASPTAPIITCPPALITSMSSSSPSFTINSSRQTLIIAPRPSSVPYSIAVGSSRLSGTSVSVTSTSSSSSVSSVAASSSPVIFLPLPQNTVSFANALKQQTCPTQLSMRFPVSTSLIRPSSNTTMKAGTIKTSLTEPHILVPLFGSSPASSAQPATLKQGNNVFRYDIQSKMLVPLVDDKKTFANAGVENRPCVSLITNNLMPNQSLQIGPKPQSQRIPFKPEISMIDGKNKKNDVTLGVKMENSAIKKQLTSTQTTVNDNPCTVRKKTVVIGKDGVHYDKETGKPFQYSDSNGQVLGVLLYCGMDGKFYDRKTGIEFKVPGVLKFVNHRPGATFFIRTNTPVGGVKGKLLNALSSKKKKSFVKKHARDKKESQKPKPKKSNKKGKKQKGKGGTPSTSESDSEFEKMLESDSEKSENDNDDDVDEDRYMKLSRRVRGAKGNRNDSPVSVECDRDGKNRASPETSGSEAEENLDDGEPIVLGRNARRAAAMNRVNYAEKDVNSADDDEEEEEEEEEDIDDTDLCKVCASAAMPHTILLCDGCDSAYHMTCLSPPLSLVPLEDWYCPVCEHKKLIEALRAKLIVARKRRNRYNAKTRKHSWEISVESFSISRDNIVGAEGRATRRKTVNYSERQYDDIVKKAVKDFNNEDASKDRKRKSKEESNSDTDRHTSKDGSSSDTEEEESGQLRQNRDRLVLKLKKHVKQNKRKSNEPQGEKKATRRSESKGKKRRKLTGLSDHESSSESDFKCSDGESESDDSGKNDGSENAEQVGEIYYTSSGRRTKNVSYT
ncbi:remodeling and spacing factor 1-like [Mya arenaria]|uniref:remodeling and spacing factor 1-like n=1 Tax=Mya arenaria TaxID=6604 RepID=UPI0022E3A296|nr:remodeling and spacing factor 1-like [Mya arenaria]